MKSIIVDTSVLWDLVLFSQKRHRRNYSIASSVAAAIESLIIYDDPIVENSSQWNDPDLCNNNRFLKFYSDSNHAIAINQFQSLLKFCGSYELTEEKENEVKNETLRMVTDLLELVSEQDHLKAYELYDYLPYHLGEDPTAIECRILDPSVSDLEFLHDGGNENHFFREVAHSLKALNHPTRAAWALPLLRLFHYQAAQKFLDAHYLPHATKSTLAFGCETETVGHRRLLDYCVYKYRKSYLKLAQNRFGGLMILLPVPRFTDSILGNFSNWDELIGRIIALRNDPMAISYRNSLASFYELLERKIPLEEQRDEINIAYDRVEQLCQEWKSQIQTSKESRTIRIAFSFTKITDTEHDISAPSQFLLIHDLYSKNGIARTNVKDGVVN